MESLWKNGIHLPSFKALEGDVRTDILIVGGGMVGLLTAYMLDRAGADYLLIEKDRICSGVTQNTTAKITSQHGLVYSRLTDIFGSDYARLYWEANEDAVSEYRRISDCISCDFENKSNFVYSVDDYDALQRETDALKNLGIPASFVCRTKLPFPFSGAVEFRNQGQFHPLKFVSGIVSGLNIRERTKGLEFRKNTVVTDKGTITASAIIIATHFPIINKHGGYFMKMHQSRSYVVALENAPDVGGMYVSAEENGFSFRNYGNMLLLGGGSHRTGKPTDGWSPLEAFARKYYPDSAIRYRWAAQDCMTLDSSAYIGRYGRSTHGLYTATGFNKWGMTQSMVAAKIFCDAVLKKTSRFAPLFNPSRKMFRPALFGNICESASNIFTFSVPRCPHLGCALKWNWAEHSWDCPCHGSRFSESGALLDNPATDGIDLN
ncbi:MAG: FAD-dependent oxidoreductase [Clostridia bacterium]|nr:FAD-dependent oxidoreductase [Clostridia bacterium]